MSLTQEMKEKILCLQNRYPSKRSALIPALHLAQKQKGYLPKDMQEEIADLFGIQPNEVHSVVSFYDMFFEKPVGKHLIHVCKNLSCMLRGADALLEGICHKLQVKPGETTQDQEFTVIASECLGACDKAPMVLLDERVIGPVSKEEMVLILEEKRG